MKSNRRWIVGAGLALSLGLLGFQKQLPVPMQVQQLDAVVNVKTLATAMNLYASDADGIYPNVENIKSLKVVTLPYVKDKKAWKTENPKSEIRFNFSVGGMLTEAIPEPDKTTMFYESKTWPDARRAVSFVSGKAGLLTPSEWATAALTLALLKPKAAKPLPATLGSTWKD